VAEKSPKGGMLTVSKHTLVRARTGLRQENINSKTATKGLERQ